MSRLLHHDMSRLLHRDMSRLLPRDMSRLLPHGMSRSTPVEQLLARVAGLAGTWQVSLWYARTTSQR